MTHLTRCRETYQLLCRKAIRHCDLCHSQQWEHGGIGGFYPEMGDYDRRYSEFHGNAEPHFCIRHPALVIDVGRDQDRGARGMSNIEFPITSDEVGDESFVM